MARPGGHEGKKGERMKRGIEMSWVYDYMDRMGRRVDPAERFRIQADAEKRARESRWSAPGRARVVHPVHGTVVVPHSSNLTAIQNAAEVWRCDWAEITDAQVWAAEPGDVPVKMPYII